MFKNSFMSRATRAMASATARASASAPAQMPAITSGVDNHSIEVSAGIFNIGEGPDVANRLPEEARAKLLRLRRERDDAKALVGASSDDFLDLQDRSQKARADLQILCEPTASAAYRGDKPVADDHPSVIQARERIARIDAESAAANKIRDQRGQRFGYFDRLVRMAETWAEDVPKGAEIVMVEVQPKKSDTVPALRSKIEKLQDELQRIDRTPVTPAMAKGRAAEIVDKLAEAAAPDVAGLLRGGDKIGWPMRKDEVLGVAYFPVINGTAGAMAGKAESKTPDTLGLLAALYRDDLVEFLHHRIDQSAGDDPGLTDEERATKEAAIIDELLDIERREAALVEASRGEFEHRQTVDPRALLAVAVADSV